MPVPPRLVSRLPLVLALALATLPLTALVLMVVPRAGFTAYLHLSSAYYSLPALVFGPRLFPTHEFGIIPDGVAAMALAAVLYALLGLALGWLLRAVATPGRPADGREDLA